MDLTQHPGKPSDLPVERAGFGATLLTYGLALLLVVHAGFRGLYADLDSVIYTTWYQELSSVESTEFWTKLVQSGWTFATREDALARFEWGFSLIGWLLGSAGAPVEAFYLLIAAISLLPKAYLACRYTRHPLLALFWYACFCYLLLEMNAMRAGVAAALMLLAFVQLFQGRRWRFASLVVVAASFHTSALFALLMLPYVRWDAGWRSLGVALLVALGLSFVDLTSLLGLLGGTFQKVAEYKAAFDSGFGDVAYLRINPLNLSSMGFLLLGLILYALVRRGPEPPMAVRAAMAVYFLPLLALLSLSSFPIVAGRLSELLCIFQMLAVAWLVGRASVTWIAQVSVVCAGALQFYIQNFRTFNVDFFYFTGPPKKEMMVLIEQKIAIDAVLSSLFSNL